MRISDLSSDVCSSDLVMASCWSGFSRKLLATKIKSSRLKPLPRECGHGSSGQQPAHLAQRGHENLDLLVRVVERQRRAAGGADAEPLQQRMRAVLAGEIGRAHV